MTQVPEQIPMPYPCCQHCQHPRHPQFTGHPSPCWQCEIAALARHLQEAGELPEYDMTVHYVSGRAAVAGTGTLADARDYSLLPGVAHVRLESGERAEYWINGEPAVRPAGIETPGIVG